MAWMEKMIGASWDVLGRLGDVLYGHSGLMYFFVNIVKLAHKHAYTNTGSDPVIVDLIFGAGA